MLYRLLIAFGAVVLFINSCNSILSGLTGTHKLRQYTIEDIEKQGVGDSDFIEITGGQRTGDFQYAPPRKGEKVGAIQYPLVSAERQMQLDSAIQTRIAVIAWTQAYDPACVERGDCAPRGPATIKGVVRKMEKSKNRTQAFDNQRYDISKYAVYVETDRAPLPWYWHLALMGVAVLLGVGTEFFYNMRQKRKQVAQD